MRAWSYALVTVCAIVWPAARVMADDSLPLKVIEQPIAMVGKTAASGVGQVVFFLNMAIGVPVACIAQGIADRSTAGCSAGAGEAFDGANLAACESGRLAIDAWTFGYVTWPPCHPSS